MNLSPDGSHRSKLSLTLIFKEVKLKKTTYIMFLRSADKLLKLSACLHFIRSRNLSSGDSAHQLIYLVKNGRGKGDTGGK